MPVSFDFINTGAFALTNAAAPPPVTNTDQDNSGGGQTVTFTVSSDAAGGTAQVVFGNGAFVGVPLSVNDDGAAGGTAANDIWTLTFVDKGDPANTRLSGTAGNPLELQIGSVALGSIKVELLDGTAVIGSTTITATDTNDTFDFGAVNISGIRFTTLSSGFDAVYLTGLSANALNCFLEGTQISTPTGPVRVETLTAGDGVLTADGTPVEVQWLGMQFVETRFTHPAKVNPICVSAGALAEGLPERDLYVSPDHAIEVDGYLINAGALVNGESIYQVRNMPLDGFTYYHIETEAHELLLAEGCPAESFLDYSDTFGFDNANERDDRVIPEMSLPRISSARMVPEDISERVAARARRIRPYARAS